MADPLRIPPTSPPSPHRSGYMQSVHCPADPLSLLWVGSAVGGEARVESTLVTKEHTFEVRLSHTLPEAEVTLAKNPVDLIVTQLSLPETFGFDSVIALHAAAPNAAIVAIAADEDEPFALQALALGAQEYLIEGSFRTRELHAAMARALERKTLERRLQQLTQLDDLTGLRNRALLRDRFDHLLLRATREKQPFVFAIIALPQALAQDDQRCDGAMRLFGTQLSRLARASDTVARLGYDRFGLLLERVPLSSREQTLQRLLAPLYSISEWGRNLRVGFSSYPDDGETVEGLLYTAQARLVQSY